MRKIYTTIIVIFILQRLLLVYYASPHISHPGFDESVSGVLAHDLAKGGLRGPLFLYQYENRSGDSLVEGFLLAFFFKFITSSMLSIKVLALIGSFICLMLWMTLMKRYACSTSTIVFCLLYALPPPMFARLNLVGTVDSHHIINILIPLQIIIILRAMVGQEKKPALWSTVLLGITMGFGTYLFYSYIIFNIFCILYVMVISNKLVNRRTVPAVVFGLLLGFMPGLIRLFYSMGGGRYLLQMLKNTSMSVWDLLQIFMFNVPHSLSYAYPERNIGFVAVFFLTLIAIAAVRIFIASRHMFSIKDIINYKNRIYSLEPIKLFTVFITIFPLFFLICLAFSPMQAAPFEFWPRVGIFAAFPPVDLFRYRWLHVLYPFYFAIIACGIGFIFKNRPGNKLLRRISLSLLIIVVLAGAMNTYKMCSFNDKKRLSYYKGYNYDQFAPKFILTDFDDISVDKAVEIAKKYPEENRGAAYQCLGTRLTRELLRCTFKKEDLLGCFENMPSCNQYDFMYGIIRALLDQPNYFKIDFVRELAEKYPLMFYENIGYSYLAYKYYGCMINKNVLFDNIAPNERRYFKTFLDEFEVKAELNIQKERLKELVEEIIFIPEVYQKTTIFGLGKLIGAEMLFDPLHMPDYPLDSKVGFMFSEERQTAFFEGVGAGFAETLCRFCRALMPSEGVLPSVYEQMIDIEWQRCLSLMKKMPPSVYMNIKQGFALAMKRRDVNQTINKHINRSYKEMQDYEINAQNKVF